MTGPLHDSRQQISFLIIDDDEQGRVALGHVLGSDWHVRVAPLGSMALVALASREWTLVIANVSLTGLDGPLFETLKELSHALALEGDKRRVRVLFLVPELLALEACAVLNRERLPYALKPVNLHDFLEKVSDLLLEAAAIAKPIRRIRFEARGRDDHRTQKSPRNRDEKPMFASREDYAMTEEEIAEFERADVEVKKEDARRREQLKKQLGEPSGR